MSKNVSEVGFKNKSKSSIKSGTDICSIDEDESVKPDFIYGGPFIPQPKADPFFNTSTPINAYLQGTFKRSFAYYTIKERLPIIITKVIDYLSRESGNIRSTTGASEDEIRKAIQYITKLKNEVMTNKKYELLTINTPEAKIWNQWIEQCDSQYYFTNIWVFTECYVYRRLKEAFELQPKLSTFDPFFAQKQSAFDSSLETMCVVSIKMQEFLAKVENDKIKEYLVVLLKLCLWSNKCDLSLSLGSVEQTTLDPIRLITDLKDKVLVDDSTKVAELIVTRAENMTKVIDTAAEQKDTENEEKEGIPCPSKMTIPSTVIFDIVCDNAGYELFSDICLAHYLISHDIVKKVRFHVKRIPWFVSDVTPKDFRYVIDGCMQAQFKKEIVAPKSESSEESGESFTITSKELQFLGQEWNKYLENGTFVLMADDFWTSPHVYKDMKKYDPQLYRKLQFAIAILFKGDLNYRKLLGEKNWNPTTSFDTCLQGFMPAPVIAIRTVKADLICGLPKGKFEQIIKLDEKWMEKGDYGLIQLCSKCEPLKPSEIPCSGHPATCEQAICPPSNVY